MPSSLLQGLFLGALPLAHASRNLPYFFPYDEYEPVPFCLSVDPEFVEQTVEKARTYRPSNDIIDAETANRGTWWEGPPSGNLTALRDYWVEEFDWAEVQREINGNFSHYAVTIEDIPDYPEDIPLHFIHETSEVEGALPVLLLHGWPSTSLEWHVVLPELLAPSNPDAPAFHVVAPDHPGLGFSPTPQYSGYGPAQSAHTFHKLMLKLGYERYGIISTDLGWYVGLFQANLYPEAVTGHISDFWVVEPNASDLVRFQSNQTTPEETAWITSAGEWASNHLSYSLVHQGAPLALGQALNDSPVGFVGWMWHLSHGVSNGYPWSFEELIRDGFLLFLPGVFGGLRWYREIFQVSPQLIIHCAVTIARAHANTSSRTPLCSRRPMSQPESVSGPWLMALIPASRASLL